MASEKEEVREGVGEDEWLRCVLTLGRGNPSRTLKSATGLDPKPMPPFPIPQIGRASCRERV